MSTAELHVPTLHLDSILTEICRALQLTQTQFEDAERKYKAVGEWLSVPGTILAAGKPSIFPQGSAATQTTVRPRTHEEFDLDLVIQIALEIADPMVLYNIIGARLREHHYYGSILQAMKRCWRLNYAGNFHMDILPAKPDRSKAGNAIWVPDTKLNAWSPSNPKDFAAWFNHQAERASLIEARKLEPLPELDDADDRPPLKRAVQLLKRHRDVYFNGDDDAPRSVVLTTLSGQNYAGEESVFRALVGILDRIAADIARSPEIMVVPNPANPAENFAESWQHNELAYRRFVKFVNDSRQEIRKLMDKTIAGGLVADLDALFGESPTKKAMERYAARMEKARVERTLRFAPAVGLTIATDRTRAVPRNTFYGEA